MIDAIRAAKQVAAQAGADINRKLFRLEDYTKELLEGVDPEVVKQVLRAGEWIHKNPRRFYEYTPEVQKLATRFYAAIGQQRNIIKDAGLEIPELGGNLKWGLRLIDGAYNKEVARLAKDIMPTLTKRQQQVFNTLQKFQKNATRINDDLVQLTSRVYDPQTFEFIGTAAQRDSLQRMNRAAQRVQHQIGKLKHQALEIAEEAAPIGAAQRTIRGLRATARRIAAERGLSAEEALRLAEQEFQLGQRIVGKQIPFTRTLEALSQDRKTIIKAIDDLPNWMPHAVSEWGLRRLILRKGPERIYRRAWNDSTLGLLERKYGKDLILKSKGVIKGTLKRYFGLDDIDDIMKGVAEAGRSTEQYGRLVDQELVARGGMWKLIEDIFDKPAKRLGRFFKLDPVEAIRHTNRQIAYAMRSKAFLEQLTRTPEVWSTVARRGWIPLKAISGDLVTRYGDVFVHPEMASELRRTYMNIFDPASTSRILRGFDWFTRIFKRAVTGFWPAYQVRNHNYDIFRMAYNGDFSPLAVHVEGLKAYRMKGAIKTSLYGALPAAELNRAARAYGILFGEVGSTGAKGWLTAPENIRRLGYFSDRLQRGRTLWQAAQEVKRVLFDYNELSVFERTAMKRLLPFYSYFRNAIRLQAEQLLTNPAIIAHVNRLGVRMRGEANIPAWTRGRGTMSLNPDTQTGEERMLVGLDFSWAEATDLLDTSGGWQPWVKKAAFRLNPLLKMGADIKPFVEGEAYFARPKVTGEWVRILPDFVKERMNIRRHRTFRRGEWYTMDARWHYLLRNLPTARLYTTVGALTKSDEPGWGRIGHFVTGMRIHRYRESEERERSEREKLQQLYRALQRKGDVGTLRIPYRRRGAEISESEVRRLRRALRRR